MDNDSIKDNIYRLRKKQALTQEQMANKIGISRNAYADIESGNTRVLSDKVERMALMNEISVEELCLGYKPVKPGYKENELKASFEKELQKIKAAYEKDLKDKDKEIASLLALVDSLKRTISYQEQIILMQRKHQGEENA